MLPGFRLRQARERLGLTYRDVERASYELAARRGRSDFIVHISRLADIENRGVVPGLHKLYSLSAIYRLNPMDIFRWYDVPIEECFHDGAAFAVPQTHLMAAPTSLRTPMKFDLAFDPQRTEFLRLVMQPHPLSHCLPEMGRVPDEAEIVGRVTGVVTRLNGPESVPHREFPE